MEDKKLQKLDKILNLAYEDYASQDEVVELFNGLTEGLKSLRTELESLISSKDRSTKNSIETISSYIEKLETKIVSLITECTQSSQLEIRSLSVRFDKELSDLRVSIPSPIDYSAEFSLIESNIAKIEESLSKIKSDSPQEVRDKLESLKNDDRLDISAIKGWDTIGATISESVVERAIGIVDSRTSFLLNKVSNLQAQVNALSSSTGGLVIEAPISGAINGSNTVFTFTTAPAYLSIDDTNKFEGTDYTRVGTTVTITNGSPPVNSIKGIS